MFYSPSMRGFYNREIHGNTIPSDAVEITSAQHAALIAGQDAGKMIVADASGFPVLQDPPPISLDDIKKSLMSAIDAAVAEVYARFQRFQVEYESREASAKAYAADPGNVPLDPSIQAFADGVAISYPAAVGRVLEQATQLRAAVANLGQLRMRKYRVQAAATESAARTEHDAIRAAINDINTALS